MLFLFLLFLLFSCVRNSLLRRPCEKALRLRRFKSDQDCSSSKYASTGGVWFFYKRPTSKFQDVHNAYVYNNSITANVNASRPAAFGVRMTDTKSPSASSCSVWHLVGARRFAEEDDGTLLWLGRRSHRVRPTTRLSPLLTTKITTASSARCSSARAQRQVQPLELTPDDEGKLPRTPKLTHSGWHQSWPCKVQGHRAWIGPMPAIYRPRQLLVDRSSSALSIQPSRSSSRPTLRALGLNLRGAPVRGWSHQIFAAALIDEKLEWWACRRWIISMIRSAVLIQITSGGARH